MAIDVRKSRKFATIMAASAAMIVAGSGISTARAQDAVDASSSAGAPPPPNGLALVNQIQNMRDQMQQMQGQIEELQHQLQQLQQTSKDQYVDLDSRIGKLEHTQAAPAGSTAAPSATAAPVASASPSPTTPATKPASPEDQAAAQAEFDAAFKSLRGGNYVDSARGFRTFVDKYPDSPLAPNAYYWLGSSYQVTQNYKPALSAFQTLLRKYPGNPKAGDTQLRVADCQIALKDYSAARATLQAVIKAHPGTALEKRARDRMNDIPPAAAKK